MRLPVAFPLLLLLWLGAPGPAIGLSYEPVYPVSEIVVEYALDHPRQIPVEEVLDLEVGLRATDEAYAAPRPVDRTVRMRLSALPAGAKLGASAVLHINRYIVSTFNRRGYNGIIVTVPDVEEGTGRDLRAPGDTVLHLRIWTGRVSRVTSIADGDRFGGLSVDERTNMPVHAWIREESPVRPGGPRGLLGVEELEDYAAEVSRHPGRQVQAELEPGPRAGTTAVNLRIAESKPWYVYAQYSNTGTSTTTLNRERFGFTHNQLLGRDDILQLDYVTGDFQKLNAFAGSYSSPFTLDAPEWRFAVRGGYSQFDAEETGFTSTKVDGTQSGAGLEVSRQIFQHHAFFLDAAVGADWMNVTVENRPFGNLRTEADVNYAAPYADLRAARDTATSTLRARLGLLGGWTPSGDSDLANVDFAGGIVFDDDDTPPALDLFGNVDVDSNFVLGRLDATFAFYLEPLIDPWAWEDPKTPESSTLAHEVAFLLRGQYAMGFRLIPQFQQVAGGFTTVRGYKQSAAVGDNLALGSVEYRLHIPRLFRPDAQPPQLWGLGAFRWRPPHVYGAPDWDLILRVFSDAAYVTSSHALDSEPDDTLWSVGGGLELQVLRNLILRGDVGYTLHELAGSNGGSGDTRGYVAATVLY